MKTVEETIAQAMDCTEPAIVPFLPYILQDFSEIGSSAHALVGIVKENTIDHQNLKVLDIGCGKGAVSILLAKELRCICVGIDAIKEFITTAQEKASEERVSDRCKFIYNDARKMIGELGCFDVIILGSVSQVFGDYRETMLILKVHLTTNGLIILDDGYMDDESTYQHEMVVRRQDLIKQIELAGMMVAREYIAGAENQSMAYEQELNKIVKRCNELGEKYPGKKRLFDEYIEKQRKEYEELETEIICSTMVIKRQ